MGPLVEYQKRNIQPSFRDYYSALMSESRQALLENAKTRSREAYDERVAAVRDRPSLSQYFDKWIANRRCDLDYFLCYRQGIINLLARHKIARDYFNKEMEAMYRDHMNELEQLAVLTTRRTYLENKLYRVWQTNRDNHVGSKDWTAISSVDGIFKVLMDRNTPRGMPAAVPPNQAGYVFRAENIGGSDGNSFQQMRSPLVPRDLGCKSLDFLLGQTGADIWDGENGLLAPSWLASALALGAMTIVPDTDVDQHGNMQCTLHLVDERYRSHGGGWWDDRTLRVVANTPRQSLRFWYLHYIITYLHAKFKGNTTWTNKVEGGLVRWHPVGGFVDEDVLCSISRSIMGGMMPDDLFRHNTFNGSVSDAELHGILLARRLRDSFLRMP
ncbi:hypothetical protein FQN53_008911 [Emmonsiellopsis sp. PD_33]|nr:hypothetical protein FQN53_008911 [Emmonsiellopsis sp. PD_33]